MNAVVFLLAGFGILLAAVALVLKVEHAQGVQHLPLKLVNSYSLAAIVFGGIGGLGFLGAGMLAHARQPENRVGLLMILVGVGYFAEDVQFAGNGWVHSVGLLFARASDGFLVHLVLAFPAGRLASRPERLLAGAAYAAVFVITPVGVLFKGPVRPNLLMVVDDSLTFAVLDNAVSAIGGVVAIGVSGVLIRRWRRAGPPLRRVLAPVFLAGVLGAAATVVVGFFEPRSPSRELVAWLPRVAFCVLPLGFLIGVWRVRRGRTAVGSLLAQLRQPMSAAALQAAVARAVGDPSLRIGYWRPEAEAFVDGNGRPLQVPWRDPAGGFTLVESGDRRIAVLLHDPALREDAHVLEAVAAAAELALENQRLTAEVRAQLAEVQDLAGRLVAAGDAERRRLERDLHDGVQQRLVTVALSLQMAVQRLGETVNGETATLFANSVAGLDAAIGELRELARGIHPMILTDAGLVPALRALVERTPEPDVCLRAADVPRLTAAEEATGYFVAAEALTNALKHAHAGKVWLAVEYEEGVLRIEVTDDGTGGADLGAGSGLLGLRDRVTALGGTLLLRSQPGHGTSVSAVIPCQAGFGVASAGRQ